FRFSREQRLDVVRVRGYDRIARDAAAHPKDVAKLTLRPEHDLNLALVEAQDLHEAWQRHGRWRGQLREMLGIGGPCRRRLRLANQCPCRRGIEGERHDIEERNSTAQI